jgi:hypothetical protein
VRGYRYDLEQFLRWFSQAKGSSSRLDDAGQAGEGDELLDVELIGAGGFRVGEPFELGGNLGEIAELGRGQRMVRRRAAQCSQPESGRFSRPAPAHSFKRENRFYHV